RARRLATITQPPAVAFGRWLLCRRCDAGRVERLPRTAAGLDRAADGATAPGARAVRRTAAAEVPSGSGAGGLPCLGLRMADREWVESTRSRSAACFLHV